MNVLQIVNEYLKANGYDGLLNPDGECACEVDGLAPCGESCNSCEPGYKQCVVPYGYDFWMHTEKCTCEVCRRGDEKKYPCEKCGTLRSENQGGKIFAVCEDCWDDNGNDLKPCPFCGERAELIKEEPVLPNGAKDEMYYVKCTNRMCQIRTMSWYPKNSAIRTWNNRR